MNDLVRKMDGFLIWGKMKAANMWHEVVEKEDGDTNFVSIGIVLVVVLLLAGAFVGFGDDFKAKLDDVFQGLLNLFD